jgi:hypothetical protein
MNHKKSACDLFREDPDRHSSTLLKIARILWPLSDRPLAPALTAPARRSPRDAPAVAARLGRTGSGLAPDDSSPKAFFDQKGLMAGIGIEGSNVTRVASGE